MVSAAGRGVLDQHVYLFMCTLCRRIDFNSTNATDKTIIEIKIFPNGFDILYQVSCTLLNDAVYVHKQYYKFIGVYFIWLLVFNKAPSKIFNIHIITIYIKNFIDNL